MNSQYGVSHNKAADPQFTDPNGPDNVYGTADDDYTLNGNNINDGEALNQCFDVSVQGTNYHMCYSDALDPERTDWTTTPPTVYILSQNDYGSWERGAYVYTGGAIPTTCSSQGYYCCPAGSTCSSPRTGSGCTGTCCASQSSCSSPTYECSDGIDNDGDTLTDLSDPGCSSPTDNDETNCGDGRCEGGETESSCYDDCFTDPGQCGHLSVPQTSIISYDDVAPSGYYLEDNYGGLGSDHNGWIYHSIDGYYTSDGIEDTAVFRYNPQTGQRQFLGTLRAITQAEGNLDPGEEIAKVHAPIHEYNGKMYFASHSFHDQSEAHRGGHFYSYDLSTGAWTDLSKFDPGGVSAPGEGIIAMDVLRNHNKLVGFTFPKGNIITYDLATQRSTNHGRPISSDPTNVARQIVATGSGKVYFSYAHYSTPLYVFDVGTGSFSTTGITLPYGWLSGAVTTKDRTKAYLVDSDGNIYSIDVSSGSVQKIGTVHVPEHSGYTITWIHGMALSPDETMLYTMPQVKDGSTNIGAFLYEYEIATGAKKSLTNVKESHGIDTYLIGVAMDNDGGVYAHSHDYNTHVVRGVRFYEECDGSGYPDLCDGLSALWHLDGSASDSSGNANDGTLYGPSPASGRFSGAYSFDGSTDYISVQPSDSLSSTSLTLSAWVYLPGSIQSGWRTILEHDRGGSNWYGLFKSSSANKFHFRWSSSATSDFSTTIYPDTWHHVAATYDASTGTTTMYLDGNPDGQVTGAPGPTDHNGNLRIGMNNDGSEAISAIIDEVAVWSRALSASEVQSLQGGPLTCGSTPDTCSSLGYQCCSACSPGTAQASYDDDCSGVCCGSCQPGQHFLPGVPVEAEDGTLTAPTQAGSDPLASGGQYIFTTARDQGSADYVFDIAVPGDYYIEASIIAPDTSSDSFFCFMDGEQLQDPNLDSWDTIETAAWTWVNVTRRGPGGDFENADFDPMVWHLDEGLHTVHMLGRETGALLDRFVLRRLAQASHRADTSGDGCIQQAELLAFIDLWYQDSTAYQMGELMEAVALYYAGTGCPA